MWEQKLSIAPFPACECAQHVLGAHLLHEVATRKWLRRGTAIVVEQMETLSGQASPMPAQVAEIQVSEVDDIRLARYEMRKEREKKSELLDEIGAVPNHVSQPCRRT